MNTISRDELKAKLDQKDPIKLVMVLDEFAFKAGHIPESLNIANIEQVPSFISVNDEIVVYCHDENCPASKIATEQLMSQGYTRVRRYPGGIRDWQEAGYPIEMEPEAEDEHALPVNLSQPITKADHRQGRMEARIQLVVYGDYECPYTRRAMTHVSGLQGRLGDEICFIYRHFPAPAKLHPHAWIAAEAALAADEQGQFWEMHKHLFKNQKALTYPDLLKYAAALGLDLALFKAGLDGHLFDERINRDRQGGWQSGVRTVPTLFINGIRYQGALKLAAILAEAAKL